MSFESEREAGGVARLANTLIARRPPLDYICMATAPVLAVALYAARRPRECYVHAQSLLADTATSTNRQTPVSSNPSCQTRIC